jgi:outer membrane protein assembly factor BamB
LSNPVVAGGRIYLTACTGYNQDRLHVLCLDETTGKQLWQRQFWATGNTLCHPKTCMAAPTPATDGQRVYALFATGDLVCLDKNGNLVWYRSLCRDYPTLGNNVGMAASPVLAGKCLVMAMENAGESFGLGVNRLTGKNGWKVGRQRGINWVTPLLFDNKGRTEVLMQSPRDVTAYDPDTGRKIWSHSATGLATIPSLVAGNGLVFVPGGKFLAVRPGGPDALGKEVWQSPRIQTHAASPLFYRGRLYTVNSVGVLTCSEGESGKVRWRLRLKGPYWASPVAADGYLYFVNENGQTSVVQVGDDAGKVAATNTLPDTLLASPVIANGAIYLRSDQHLYCIGGKGK